MQQEVDRHATETMRHHGLFEQFSVRGNLALQEFATRQHRLRLPGISLHHGKRDALRPGFYTQQSADRGGAAPGEQPHEFLAIQQYRLPYRDDSDTAKRRSKLPLLKMEATLKHQAEDIQILSLFWTLR